MRRFVFGVSGIADSPDRVPRAEQGSEIDESLTHVGVIVQSPLGTEDQNDLSTFRPFGAGQNDARRG